MTISLIMFLMFIAITLWESRIGPRKGRLARVPILRLAGRLKDGRTESRWPATT